MFGRAGILSSGSANGVIMQILASGFVILLARRTTNLPPGTDDLEQNLTLHSPSFSLCFLCFVHVLLVHQTPPPSSSNSVTPLSPVVLKCQVLLYSEPFIQVIMTTTSPLPNKHSQYSFGSSDWHLASLPNIK